MAQGAGESGGKPSGRPKKKRSRREGKAGRFYRQRIPIEGKFGQGKNHYGLDKIKAKTCKTSEAWIRSIFL
ncbi:MAG: transposase [Acidobacteria bacterium]|nr:transposase [Acidobacteriota bacterium]